MSEFFAPSLLELTNIFSLGAVAMISVKREQLLAITTLFLYFAWKFNFWSFLAIFHHLSLHMGNPLIRPPFLLTKILSLGTITVNDIGWSKKKYSIKVKKKCTKKWRWPSRELKIWYMYNNIIVFLFTKKYFSYFDLYSWYGHFNVRFWQFWHWPNVFKFCSKIVFCL